MLSANVWDALTSLRENVQDSCSLQISEKILGRKISFPLPVVAQDSSKSVSSFSDRINKHNLRNLIINTIFFSAQYLLHVH